MIEYMAASTQLGVEILVLGIPTPYAFARLFHVQCRVQTNHIHWDTPSPPFANN